MKNWLLLVSSKPRLAADSMKGQVCLHMGDATGDAGSRIFFNQCGGAGLCCTLMPLQCIQYEQPTTAAASTQHSLTHKPSGCWEPGRVASLCPVMVHGQQHKNLISVIAYL